MLKEVSFIHVNFIAIRNQNFNYFLSKQRFIFYIYLLCVHL